MRTVNKVILIGNVAKDPLIRETQNTGSKNAMFVVATNRVYTDRSGTQQSEAEFSNCIAWGPLADRCQEFLCKGKLVYIEGRLNTRVTDREDGTRSYRTEIVVTNLIFLNKRGDFEDAKPNVVQKSDDKPVEKEDVKSEKVTDEIDAIDDALDIDDAF